MRVLRVALLVLLSAPAGVRAEAPACSAEVTRALVAVFDAAARVPYDAAVLPAPQADVVRAIAGQLADAGVEAVTLEGHVGAFCLARSGGRLAKDSDPAAKCGRMTAEYALPVGERMAHAVGKLVTEGSNGRIRVRTVSHGMERPIAPVPPGGHETAGAVNRAAHLDNRVGLVIDESR